MLTCINKKSPEYLTLKNRSGIQDFILEAVCRDFLDKYDRFPNLDELPEANSEPYLRKTLGINLYNGAEINNILEKTGASTIEEANATINNEYRDLEVSIIPLNKEAIIDVEHRPTDNNFDNWTEEDEILAKAPRDENGNLLAPNGKPSNLTESQYALVRSKAFKKWFGDWEKANTFNIDAIDTSKVDIEEHNKPWKNDSTKSNKTLRIYIKGLHEKGYFELVKDNEFGMFSVHFKTTKAGAKYNSPTATESTKENRKTLFTELVKAIPEGGMVSTWGSISEEGIRGIKNVGRGMTKVGEREVTLKSDGSTIKIPIYQKGKGVSKVVDENGEPLVVYHGSKNGNFDTFDYNYLRKTDSGFFFTSDKEYAKQFGNTREFFLNIKNPNLTNIPLNIDTVETLLTVNYIRGTDGIQGHDDTNTNENLSKSKGQEYVAVRSNQIKSATDNSGLFSRTNDNIYDPAPNGYLVMTNALLKLASLYGIKFNEITDAELASDRWRNIISDPSSVNAFVYNGLIYINISRANLDAPIHEMMHLFVGSIRFQNPNLYLHLISLSEQFPNYNKLAREFSGRTRNDINEEIFVLEVSKYLVGLPSNISNIESKLLYEITYNIKRVLDTILMGLDSVKTISGDRLFNLSLKLLAQEINSSIMTNNFRGTLDVEGSELHRKLNNIKSDLIKQKLLEEDCD